ncbi:MAG: hypothetical protein KBT11_08390 [Treponema sp.]|nr:hypothetical protein [Candidatus Treponema equifaecale]
MQNTRLNRLRTALAVLLLAFSIFSVATVTLEKNHECSGEDCSICFVITVAKQSLNLLSLIAVFVVARACFIASKKTNSILFKSSLIKSNTLISQKTRIND